MSYCFGAFGAFGAGGGGAAAASGTGNCGVAVDSSSGRAAARDVLPPGDWRGARASFGVGLGSIAIIPSPQPGLLGAGAAAGLPGRGGGVRASRGADALAIPER